MERENGDPFPRASGCEHGKERGVELGEVYRRWGPVMYRRILSFYDESEAEEVLHEIFAKLIERWSTFQGQSSPTTWLYRVTTNHCLNRVRDTTRRRRLLSNHAEASLEDTFAKADQASRVLASQLWAEIPERLLAFAVYYHVDGMSHAEIAQVTGVSRRTVGNRLKEFETYAMRLRKANE